MYNAFIHTTTHLPRAPTVLSAIFAHKTVPREANTAFFRVIMLSPDLRSVIRDILMVVWVNSPIICLPAHLLCLTSRGRSHVLYSHLSTWTFPLLNVKGPFTSSILTFVHLNISQRWPVKIQFLQRTSIDPILASFFCPLRTVIHHIFLNFFLWPEHSFPPHRFSIHVNQTRSHVRWRQYFLRNVGWRITTRRKNQKRDHQIINDHHENLKNFSMI